jgi:carbon-monoxide dehydrogenase large subunit
MERAVDHAAREIGMAPDAIRRKNLIKPKALPYTTPTGKVYDSGDFAATLARAQELADWENFGKRAREAKRVGKLRGIGIGTYVEACGGNGPETAHVTLDRDGGITVLIGSQSSGQGHATSYAQLVAERLDIAPERVRVIQGDTDRIPTGAGTGGSSSIPVGGVSVDRASKTLAEQLKELAAEALEASAGDMEIVDAKVRVAGTDRAISFADLAVHPAATPEKLKAASDFSPDVPTYPNGTHIAEVEIDPDTGVTDIVSYRTVDDCGVVVNHAIVEGQIHGAVAQGAGQVFGEHAIYDRETGQLLTATFSDYFMPRAGLLPDLEMEEHPSASKVNPLGIKGTGEAGCAASLPALVNAVVDALRPLGVKHLDMPLTASKVWATIAAARAKQ